MVKKTARILTVPIIVSLLALALVAWWGGAAALILALVLTVLEISLSFDNAVVNAKILQKMPPRWQKRFLTWGMAFSVFGVRLILPILIVSATAVLSPAAVVELAFAHPARYGALVVRAQPAIDAFGSIFLFLVAARFFLDANKSIHWIRPVERRLARFGTIASVEVAAALALLLCISFWTLAPQVLVLESGLVGIMLFLVMRSLTDSLGAQASLSAHSGLSLFIYLNILDAAFSLDGVIGAFAITALVPIIFVGLGLGAYFVRSITLLLAQGEKLKELRYLEHGAYWAVFALAFCMLASLVVPIPEPLVASASFIIILLSYFSSRKEIQRELRRAV